MNTLVIIPVCNFYECLKEIVDFYKENLDEANIIIVDDSKDKEFIKSVNYIYNGAYCIRNNKPGDLRNAFLFGLSEGKRFFNKHYDLVITNEHDVIPKIDALYAALSIFENKYLMKGMASVSTIYKWKGVDCYPTHPHWYNGWTIQNTKESGTCKVIGAQGIPFGFALWRPEVLAFLNDQNLPLIWKLDSKFGELIYLKGYHHIRMVDYYVEHYNKGVKSWKEAN